MTQEEKQLLLKDLCARLPYGVFVHIRYKEGEPCYGKLTPRDIQWFIDSNIENIKPYLKPMNSMTEEECKILGNISATLEDKLIEVLPNIPYYIEVAVPDQIDWLNKYHFDYRGLIPMGLALEAQEGMYE